MSEGRPARLGFGTVLPWLVAEQGEGSYKQDSTICFKVVPLDPCPFSEHAYVRTGPHCLSSPQLRHTATVKWGGGGGEEERKFIFLKKKKHYRTNLCLPN